MGSSSSARRTGLALALVLVACAAWLVFARRPTGRGVRPEESSAARTAADVPRVELETARAPVAETEPRLALAPEPEGPTLTVNVVDQEDQPVGGIGLELLAVRGPEHVEVLASATTLPSDGRARLVPGHDPGPTLYRVVCREAFSPAPTLELGSELPRAPVTLRLPLHGALEVQLVRAGKPVRHAARIDLRRVAELDAPLHSASAVEGRARFAAVGLGQELELSATCEESGPCEPVRVVGPQRAGEVVPLTLALGPIWPRVRLRVVDADEEPIAGERFEGWVDYGASSAPLTSCPRSDEAGWLEFHLPGGAPEHGGRFLVLRALRPGAPQELRLRLAILDPLDPELTSDLGVVHLPAQPAQGARD